MKNLRLLSLICACMLLCLPCAALAEGELSYTDAKALIELHNQYRNYKPTGGLKDGAYGYYDARNFPLQNGKYWCWWGNVYGVDCLEQGGCHAFSFSHAVQWCLKENLGDEVLYALIDACENPSDYGAYHFYPKCRASAYAHKTSTQAYLQLCRDEYGLCAESAGAPERTAEGWTEFFDSGRVAVLAVDGHYNVAVDYLFYEGAVYVQILDSAPNASVSRTWGSAYMVYKNQKVYSIGTPAFTMGPFQYWVSMDDFLSGYLSVDAVLSGGKWQGHDAGDGI